MSGEQAGALPDDLQRWLEDWAESADERPEAVLTRAVRLYRQLEEREASDGGPTLDDLTAEVESVADRLDATESAFDDKLQDVRKRVVQVKRETDQKAPAGHDHPDLTERLEDLATTTADLHEELDAMGARLDKGFENYEDILEYLTDETDELDEKLHRLAATVVSLRQRVGEMEAELTRLDATAELQETANRHGDAHADCEECGAHLDVGLLSRARCPHCEASFVDIEPSGRFFRNAKLTTGDRPALVAGDDESPVDTDVTTEDLLEGEHE